MTNFLKKIFGGVTLRRVLLGLALSACVTSALAAAPVTVSQITGNVNTALKGIGSLLTSIALIAGIGFILVSFFKFHQHKLNPTQVPMSQGITLLVIGACLTVFPSLIKTPASTIVSGSDVTKFSASNFSV